MSIALQFETKDEIVKINIDMDFLEERIATIKASPAKNDPVIKAILEMYKLELFIGKRLNSNASSIALVPSLRAKLNELSGAFLEAVEGDLESGKVNEGKYLLMADVSKANHDQCTMLLDVLELGLDIKCNKFNI
jgi:hypothetical protein